MRNNKTIIKPLLSSSKKISIIIPCYNCENTIDYCIDSILAQTISIYDLEIILVNDASTDGTLSKLYKYENLYPDIFLVINCTENGKQGTARNIALSYATGEYIAYVDADDVMEHNMYELMYKAACQTDAQVIISASETVSEIPCLNTFRSNALLLKEIVEIITDEDRENLIFYKNFNIAAWNKLYKRQFLLDYNIYFAEHIIYEDILFTMLMKMNVSKLCILNNVFYYHIMNYSSCTKNTTLNEERIFHYLAVYAEVVEAFKKQGKYNLYRNCLFNWYLKAYCKCAAYYHITHGLTVYYLKLMDDSIEQLFPGMANPNELHKSIEKTIMENCKNLM